MNSLSQPCFIHVYIIVTYGVLQRCFYRCWSRLRGRFHDLLDVYHMYLCGLPKKPHTTRIPSTDIGALLNVMFLYCDILFNLVNIEKATVSQV